MSDDGEKPALEQLEPPFFSVAKSDAVIQALLSAICFWDKLGLNPRAGKNNVRAFVFFEECDEARVDPVEKWLQWVSSTYVVGGTVIRLSRHLPLTHFGRDITLGSMSAAYQ
jgi:mediator of RNA polymerase II transcription subunit 13, fungi type